MINTSMLPYSFPLNLKFNPLDSSYDYWTDTTYHKKIPIDFASTELKKFRTGKKFIDCTY